jgi:autoinducer 2-degrading protein
MLVTTVLIQVKPEHVQDFIQATIENHENSIQEPGNLRFDVLQSLQDPVRFTLVEAYLSEEAAATHKQTAHYVKWRDTVASWMAKPREGTPHRAIRPTEPGQW